MINNLLQYILLNPKIYSSREELDQYRLNLLKKQLSNAYQNIPYYKNAFDNAGLNPLTFKSIEDLSTYPIITKNIVRTNSSQLLNQKLLIKDKFKSHTSGSTGQPMWTYYDLISWIRKKYIIKARARIECGIKPLEKIVIFETFSQNSSDKANIFFRTLKSRYKVLSISEPFEETIRKLDTFSPAAIYGAPSHLFQLAKFIKKNNFQLPYIKRIFTSSEYLQETVRDYINEKFNAEVYDIYGSTEFKEVAWECEKHEGYHINEDEVIIEIVKNGKPAQPDTVGNIVITDLRNTVMPLIRYQLQDKGMLNSEKCSCGRTFSTMKPLAGRSSEYIILPNGEILSPYLFTTNIEKISGLHQYQVVQKTKENISVNIITNGKDFNTIAITIKNVLSNVTKHMMEIEVEPKTHLDIEENGKFKVVKNLTLEEREIKT